MTFVQCQILVKTDLTEAFVFAVRRTDGVHQFAQFIAGFQTIHPFQIHSQLTAAVAGGFQQFRQFVDAFCDRTGRQFACFFDVIGVDLPQTVVQISICFSCSLRRAVADIRFSEAFICTDFQHVDCDTQFIQRIAVIIAIAAETGDRHHPHRVHVDLIGVRCQQVLLLTVRGTPGDDFFAGRAEFIQCCGNFTLQYQTTAVQLIQQQNNAGDFAVVFGGIDCFQNIA